MHGNLGRGPDHFHKNQRKHYYDEHNIAGFTVSVTGLGLGRNGRKKKNKKDHKDQKDK